MRSRDTFLNVFPSLLLTTELHLKLTSYPFPLHRYGLRADFLIVMYRIWHHHIDAAGRLSLYYWIPVVIIIYCFASHKHHYTAASSYTPPPSTQVGAGVGAVGSSRTSPEGCEKKILLWWRKRHNYLQQYL